MKIWCQLTSRAPKMPPVSDFTSLHTIHRYVCFYFVNCGLFNMYVNQNCLTLTCTYMMSESGEIQPFEFVSSFAFTSTVI